MDIPMHIIAHIETAFPSKFGIPRQSGLVPSLRGTIIFVPEYRKTFGQLTAEEKSAISHRGRALKDFVAKLETFLKK